MRQRSLPRDGQTHGKAEDFGLSTAKGLNKRYGARSTGAAGVYRVPSTLGTTCSVVPADLPPYFLKDVARGPSTVSQAAPPATPVAKAGAEAFQ